ncbi:MAG: hypothetical protein ACOYPR_00360 [Saprospiraceae bacterium]
MFNLLHLPFKIFRRGCCHISVVLLIVLFISSQAQAQVPIPKKQGQDSSKVVQPFSPYLDLNLGLFFFGANANVGVLLNQTHGFGVSYGGVVVYRNIFFANSGKVFGFQYRFTPVKAPGAFKRLLMRAEFGKVINSSYSDDSNYILRPDLNNNYYIRGTVGFRMRALVLGLSFLHSGRQGIAFADNPISPNPNYTRIEYYHLDGVFFEVGIALPALRKIRKQKLD